MTAITFKEAALAAAPDVPRSVREYLTHLVNNKFHAVLGRLYLAEHSENHAQACPHIQAAAEACKNLMEELSPFLTEAKR